MTQEIGPWNDEPDTLDFDHAGLRCAMRRNHFGAWCGYVAVPEGHGLHGKHYDTLDASVHGGLTHCGEDWPESGAGWWFGFDCSHAGDFCPGLDNHYGNSTYRDAEYVKNECQQLAEQIAAWQPQRDLEADLREALDALVIAHATIKRLTKSRDGSDADIQNDNEREVIFAKHGRAV